MRQLVEEMNEVAETCRDRGRVAERLELEKDLERQLELGEDLERRLGLGKDLEMQFLLLHEMPNLRKARSKPRLQGSSQTWAWARRGNHPLAWALAGRPPMHALTDCFESFSQTEDDGRC